MHTHAHTPHKHTHRHTHFFPFSGFSVGLCIKEDGPSLARTNILTGCFSRHQGESVNPPNVLTHPSHIGYHHQWSSPVCWWFLWPCHGSISPHLSSHGSDDGRIQSGDTCPCAWASCFKDVYLHTPHTPHQSCTIHHTVDSFMIVHIHVWWEGHGWAGSSWRQVRCGISLCCCTCQDSNWSVGWSRPGLPEVLLPLNNFTVCSRARLRTIIQCEECGNGLIDWYPLEEMQNMHDNEAI